MQAPHEILKQARLAQGLSQNQAAERCGVSFSAYEKWERGHKIMPPVMTGLLVMLGAPPSVALAAGRELARG